MKNFRSLRIDSCDLQRRNGLILMGSAILLAACGKGTAASGERGGSSVSQAAQSGVSAGLAGVIYASVTPTATNLAVAGTRKIGANDPLLSTDPMMIGSCTKAMTAYLTARVIQRGQLSWTTTIAQVLPTTAETMLPAYQSTTVEQLLNMVSGLPSFLNGGEQDVYPLFLAYLANYSGALPAGLPLQRLFFANWIVAQTPQQGIAPGRDFFYSNANYILLGAMLEAVTGVSFEALFAQELQQQLGVSGLWIRPELLSVSGPYGHTGTSAQLQIVPLDPPYIRAWEGIVNSAGLFVTTANDYAVWLRWHLLALQGKATPLPSDYIERIRQLNVGQYGVGWGCATNNGRPVLTHTGEWEGFTTENYVDRAGACAAFGMTNTIDVDGSPSTWVVNTLNQSLVLIDQYYYPQPL